MDAPRLADALGVGKVFVKDESNRLGLPAFKILGASWAVYRALEERVGDEGFGDWETIEDLKAKLEPLRPLTLVAATDGNHGRAVARVARLLGLGARIFVPGDMAPARREAIAGEDAEVVVVDGTYDERSRRSAEADGLPDLGHVLARLRAYSSWVIEGYSTMLWEIEDELERRGEAGPDLVVVQVGVGAFAAAVARHFRSPSVTPHPKLVGVEPAGAACLFESVSAGRLVSVPGPHDSIMAGLNCGRPSLVAWPTLSRLSTSSFPWTTGRHARLCAWGQDLASSRARPGLRDSAACSQLLRADEGEEARRALGVGGETRVLVFNTEGATDPDAYRRVTAG